jgi:hypothetical protein
MTDLPWALIPAVLVPLLLFLHVVIAVKFAAQPSATHLAESNA